MLIILALFLSTALANSHEKYIDLLPEEEKQEFLNKVARRILETVDNTENSDKTSKELNDEDLKGHHKFVQDILQEESGHIRRRRADRNSDDEIEASENSGQIDNRRADDTSSDDENNASEHLEVKPLKLESNTHDGEKIDKSSDTDNASSSAYGIERRSYDEPIQESPKDYIKVEIVTDKVDDASDEPKSNIRSKTSIKKGITNRELKDIKTSTANVKRQKDKPKYVESTTKFQDLKHEGINNTTYTTDERKKEYTVSNSSLSNINNSKTNKKSESEPIAELPSKVDRNIYTLTSTTAASETHTTNRGEGDENNPIPLVTTGKYSTTKPTPSNTIINSSTDGGTKDIFIDLTSYLTTTKSPALNKYSEQSPKLFKSKGVTMEKVSKRKTPKNGLKLKTATTRSPSLTPTNIEVTPTKKPKKIIKIKKKSENTTVITFFSDNPLKKSKSEFNLNMPKPNIKKTYEKQTNLQPYQVYEIPWPDASQNKPFLRNAEPMQDQPYFVPVYKYSPNYAFYNPTNRRGPNVVEENSIELDTNPLRKGKIKGKKPEANEFILQLNDELRKFGVYKKIQEEYAEETVASTTPGDEEDSKENTVMQLPDSYENLHPYNGMNNGLKTHIKAVRDVLFKKKVYNKADTSKEDHLNFLYTSTNRSVPVLEQRLRHFDKKKFPALRNHHVRNRDIDLNYYFKALNRLQDQETNEVHDMNELLIISHANDKINDHTAEHRDEAIKDEPSNMNTIAKILEVTDEKDFVTTLEKLRKLNLRLMRRNEDVKIGIYMKVLKDLIKKDSKALKQYDWLATTVQIQSALDKLSLLIERKRNSEPIHPADVQILKYAVFIHNFSLELRGANEIKSNLRNKGKLLPRGKVKKDKKITEKGLINRDWLFVRTLLPDLTADDGLNNLHKFLLDVEDALFDLHEAITNIAKVTRFKQQNWFDNIKELYLTTDEKHLREILLHLSFARLIDLIEKGCENGLEKDFILYMKTHKKESKRTLEEILFVLNILDQIKNNLE
ncbi:unnamed protein product [Arctia plantaginis]|uniref:Uncharacterized protein n=1 Tax=Arctia plantaginis TaxID=874455 RepID=A0A8S0YVX0_ARCPL|nr:unnamed protein product [Arctia plantaginis]